MCPSPKPRGLRGSHCAPSPGREQRLFADSESLGSTCLVIVAWQGPSPLPIPASQGQVPASSRVPTFLRRDPPQGIQTVPNTVPLGGGTQGEAPRGGRGVVAPLQGTGGEIRDGFWGQGITLSSPSRRRGAPSPRHRCGRQRWAPCFPGCFALWRQLGGSGWSPTPAAPCG